MPPVESQSTNEPSSSQPIAPNPGPNKGGKKGLIFGIIAALLVFAGLAIYAATNNSSGTKDSKNPTTSQDSNNPSHIDGIAVGSYRYVNACQAFPGTDEQNVFALLSATSSFSDQHADDGLPVKDTPSDGVVSSCSRSFGSDTTYADASVVVTIRQFATTTAAQSYFDGVKKVSDPLSGAAGSYYDANIDTSYTLKDNKVISFGAALSGVPVATFQAGIVKALPGVMTNIANPKLPQKTNVDPDFGRKIGDSTYLEPCQTFTGDDFQKMTGAAQDPTDVEFKYYYQAPDYLRTDNSTGDAYDSCSRISNYGVKDSRAIDVTFQYFKSASEASSVIQQHFAKLSSETGYKMQNVSGVGDYAFYETTTDNTYLSFLDVQKGPYILEFNIHKNGSNSLASSDDYVKAANVLLPKLP